MRNNITPFHAISACALIVSGFALSACSEQIQEQEQQQASNQQLTTVSLKIAKDENEANTRALSFDADGKMTNEFQVGEPLYLYFSTDNKSTGANLAQYKLTCQSIETQEDKQYALFSGDIPLKSLGGNSLYLYGFYNCNIVTNAGAYYTYPGWDYTQQDGSAAAAGKCDFGYFKVEIGMTEDERFDENGSYILYDYDNEKQTRQKKADQTIHLQSGGSILRMKYAFKDAAGNAIDQPKDIDTMYVSPTYGHIDALVNPLYETSDGDIMISGYQRINHFEKPVITSDGYFYLAMPGIYQRSYDTDDQIKNTQILTELTTKSGDVYRGLTSKFPGGFQKGKYYRAGVNMKYVAHIPNWTFNETTPAEHNYRKVFDNNIELLDANPIDITISGRCVNYSFYINPEGNNRVTLDNLTVSLLPESPYLTKTFLSSESNAQVLLLLKGDNVIDYTNNNNIKQTLTPILLLKLMLGLADGEQEATLTITSKSNDYQGINNGKSAQENRFQLMDGCTLIIEDAGNAGNTATPALNTNGTYTWKYTLRRKGNSTFSHEGYDNAGEGDGGIK